MKNFIKLFLNQLYIGIATAPPVYQLYEKALFDMEFSYNIEINLHSNNLYLTVFSSVRKRDNTNDLIFKSKTTFKIEVNPFNKGNTGFVAKSGLIDSIMSCNNKHKYILDIRNFLEKLIDFITSISEKVTAEVNSDTSLKSNPKLKSKPLFFVSEDGESMKNLSYDNLSKELLSNFFKITKKY